MELGTHEDWKDWPEKDHAHAGYGGGWGTAEVVSFKQKVNVGSELDAFSAGHGQQPIIIEHRVQALNPLRVYVAIAHNPWIHLWKNKDTSHRICRRYTQYINLCTYSVQYKNADCLNLTPQHTE